MVHALARLSLAPIYLVALAAWAQPPGRYASPPERQTNPNELAPRRPQTEPSRPLAQPPVGGGPVPRSDSSGSFTPQGGRPTYPTQPAQGIRPAENSPTFPGAAPQAPPPPRAPFQLTNHEQEAVDKALTTWEKESAKVKNYSCDRFERWEYDPVFFPPGNQPKSKHRGELRYSKPDKGIFKIEETYDTKAGTWIPMSETLREHWVCDGENIYELNPTQKHLITRPIPPNMRGHAIAEGPLPFLFGAEKAKIERRYYVQITTPPENEKDQIWLKAYPKFQADAANFDYVEIILDRHKFLPVALMVYLPGGNGQSDRLRARTLYLLHLDATATNNGGGLNPMDWLKGIKKPSLPRGWKEITEAVPTQPAASAPAQSPDQAKRPLPPRRQ